MYEEALAALAEPQEIKERLPIAYVLEKAGNRIISGEGRLHALCPFHADHSPSFDIFPWGSAERWGCWVCGIGGDVFDLMQRLWSLGFRDAVAAGRRGVALMEQEGWKAPALGQLYEWDEVAAANLLYRCSDLTGLGLLLAAKGLPVPAYQVHEEWGVRSTATEVLVPYWDEAGLVAVKHRPANGSRPWISLPGSRLRGALYEPCNPQMGKGAGPILLTEGETDAWFAHWAVGHAYDVRSVAAGAGAPPTRLESFRGRPCTIAFDGDDAGRTGAARWADALSVVASSVQVLDMPDGYDLCSLRDLSFLL